MLYMYGQDNYRWATVGTYCSDCQHIFQQTTMRCNIHRPALLLVWPLWLWEGYFASKLSDFVAKNVGLPMVVPLAQVLRILSPFSCQTQHIAALTPEEISDKLQISFRNSCVSEICKCYPWLLHLYLVGSGAINRN